MPPRKKDLLKPKPKGKLKAPEPQSENDFLEVADEHEQAAGKWRAGDAAKATRFFNRAIDAYTEGLKRHPQSFDLAYNKANLEFNLTEDERIIPHLGNRTALLEETLKSHRFAISLNPTNIDILFNTAQVLTSLAEAELEVGTTASGKYEARPLLEEAVEIFTKCLESQQQEYAQMQADIAKAQASGDYQEAWEGERQQSNDAPDDCMDTASSAASEAPGDWATVEEPLTPESILETCTAQLGAITTLLGLYDPATDLASMEKKAQDGLETANTRIPVLVDLIATASPLSAPPPPQQEAGPTLSIGSTAAATEEASTTPQDDAILAAATFQASIAEMTYRSGQSTPTTYAESIERIFSALPPTANTNTNTNTSTPLAALNIQSAYADALIDLASTLSDTASHNINDINDNDNPTTTALTLQWTALSQAQTTLTHIATTTPLLPPSRLAPIYLARGDTDLFRFRIADATPAWRRSRAVLVQNAGVFYRGAIAWAGKSGDVGCGEVGRVAEVKAWVVGVLMGEGKEGWRGSGEVVGRVVEQMVGEGVLGRDEAERVLGLLR